MRTTVDIPEGVLRRVKALAAMDGVKMKDVVNRALEAYLQQRSAESRRVAEPRRGARLRSVGRFTLPVLASELPGSREVTPEMLKDEDSREDEDRHDAVFGR